MGYKYELCCNCSHFMQGRIYFANLFFNGIFSLNPHDFSVEFLGLVPGVNKQSKRTHLTCTGDSKCALFFPEFCHSIVICDGTTGTMQTVDIPMANGKNNYEAAGGILVGNSCWCLPKKAENHIWQINTETLQIAQDVALENALADMGDFEYWETMPEGKIYSVSKYNKLISVDVINKRVNIITTFPAEWQIYRVKYDGECFWLIFENSADVAAWNCVTGDTKIYTSENEPKWSNCVDRLPYANIVFIEDCVFLPNFNLLNIMKINKEDARAKIKKAFDCPNGYNYYKYNDEFAFGLGIMRSVILINNVLYFFSPRGNFSVVYNYLTHEKKVIKLIFETEERQWEENLIIYENLDDTQSLDKFLTKIINDGNKYKSPIINYGDIIYQQIMR